MPTPHWSGLCWLMAAIRPQESAFIWRRVYTKEQTGQSDWSISLTRVGACDKPQAYATALRFSRLVCVPKEGACEANTLSDISRSPDHSGVRPERTGIHHGHCVGPGARH